MKTCTPYAEYIQAQVRAMRQFRRLACQLAGQDLGQEPVLEWIAQNARDFREHWENSKRRQRAKAGKK